MSDDISIHVFKGAILVGMYNSKDEFTTGFNRLDNELRNVEESYMYNDMAKTHDMVEAVLTSGADRDGDFRRVNKELGKHEDKFLVDSKKWLNDVKLTPEVHNENRFRFITEEMVTLYSKKNADYGDAFTQSLDEDGLLVSKIRIKDKLNRFSQLIDNEAFVSDESMRDTLIDLANYTVMTLMWLDNNE